MEVCALQSICSSYLIKWLTLQPLFKDFQERLLLLTTLTCGLFNFVIILTLCHLEHRCCCQSSFLSKGYTGWFAIAFPAVFWAGICNLAIQPPIARPHFICEEHRGDFSRPLTDGRRDTQFNVHRRNGTHIDYSLNPWNTEMTVYSCVRILTQASWTV